MSKDVKKRSLVRLWVDLSSAASVLGLLEQRPREYLGEHRERKAKMLGLDTGEIDRLVQKRGQARVAKDFTQADEVRQVLAGLGVDVRDTEAGPHWRFR